ncbi:MAG: DinB family protein [Planctomycetota bacterium]
MTDELAEAFLINNRATLLVLRELSDEALAASLSTRGGRTVGQQFVHVHEVRRDKVARADRELGAGLPKLSREDGHDRDLLIDAFERAGEAVAELIRRSLSDGGKVKGFKRGIHALVTYLVAHDAHHRGHALLTCKQARVKRPETLRFGPWDWNRL